jgi:glyoxylase I family protein
MELFQAGGDAEGVRGGEQKVGFKHLCFEVPDIKAKATELQAQGIETGDIIDCSAVTPGLMVCFLKDPEGNVIELMEGWEDEENPPQLA